MANKPWHCKQAWFATQRVSSVYPLNITRRIINNHFNYRSLFDLVYHLPEVKLNRSPQIFSVTRPSGVASNPPTLRLTAFTPLGTWFFVFSTNPCTRVHGILIFLQIHVCTSGFFIILMYSSGGEGGPAQKKKKKKIGNFFSTCEKINQFGEFCKDQGGKI